MEEDKNRNLMGGKNGTLKKEHNLDSAPGWEALEKRLNEMEKKPLSKIGYWLEARQDQVFYHTISSLGAGLLGLGLGILFSTWLGSWASFLVAGGMVTFGWGICMLHLSEKLWWLRLPKWLQLSMVVGYGIASALLAWLLENIFQQ
jgi:hypothetical protein